MKGRDALYSFEHGYGSKFRVFKKYPNWVVSREVIQQAKKVVNYGANLDIDA